jgi:hypothetical protein
MGRLPRLPSRPPQEIILADDFLFDGLNQDREGIGTVSLAPEREIPFVAIMLLLNRPHRFAPKDLAADPARGSVGR